MLLLVVALVKPAAGQDGAPFVPGCSTLPFTGHQQPIDDDCGIDGKSTAAASKLESQAKNDLCAAGPAVFTTFWTFEKLKRANEALGFTLGADRSGARKLVVTNPAGVTVGEGKRVMLAGWVLRAHVSDGGENVNCTRSGKQNDIHVHIAPAKDKTVANFCKAVVAEAIPHLRPDAMNEGDIAFTNDDAADIKHPVRVTGHLFYDGHHPVKCDTAIKANSRVSKWEIHPVYAIDVCKNQSLASCDPRDNSKWMSLAAWIATQHEEDPDQ